MPKSFSFDKFDIDEIYTSVYQNTSEELLELKRNKNISGMAVKTYKSGEMLELEIYPFYSTPKEIQRAPKKNESRKAQKNLNTKNAVKRLVRLINTNFKADQDIWIHLPYDDEHLPDDIDAARREMQNYIKRLKRYSIKMGWDELKYIYVVEGGAASKTRFHHHMVINFPDRDVAEKLWHGGKYPRANRLKDSAFKFEGMARYMGKVKRQENGKITVKPKSDLEAGSKRYVPSRNLKQPFKSIAYRKISKNRAYRILKGEIDAKTEFESICKGYKFLDKEAFTSEWCSGVYIYVRMRC
jgi:hypothetical protein